MQATETREHPILFSGALVRAILDGQKTQTRRIIKPQPPIMPRRSIGVSSEHGSGLYWTGGNNEWLAKCPYGKPGDVMWVREAFQLFECQNIEHDEWDVWGGSPSEAVDTGMIGHSHGIAVKYRATDDVPDEVGWRPSIHMPRKLCRLRLRIEDVRVERVQEITEEDALAEGFEQDEYGSVEYDGRYHHHADYAFARLWDHVNGERDGGIYSWEANPWVWVLEFSPITED